MELVEKLLIDNIDLWSSADSIKSLGRGRVSAASINCYGVEKLRDVILQLAVRGRLLEQRATDIPASHLLKEAETYASGLASRGINRKQKKYQSVSAEEMSFVTPKGWEWVRLGQLGDWGAGATPLRGTASFYGGDIPWFKSGELSQDFIRVSEETVTELALEKCSLRMNRPGDVLLAMYGATIGKASILEVSGTTNQAVCACTPYPGISNRYLLLLLKAMRSNFIGQGAGGAQPNISREKIIATPVAIPPGEEQERISLKVDELMALCDILEDKSIEASLSHINLVKNFLSALISSDSNKSFEDNWKNIADSIDVLFSSTSSIEVLKTTILQLAIDGKLVAQDIKDESASKLLQKILAARLNPTSTGRFKETKSLKATNAESGDKHNLPESWVLSSLQNIYDVRDGTHDTPKYCKEGYPLITSKNLYSGSLDFTDVKYISEEDHLKIKKRSEVNFGDVLFAMIGTIGNAVIVDTKEEFSIKNIALFKPYVAEYSEMNYLLIFLKHITAQLKDEASGAVQSFVSLGMLRNYPFPLPPLAEQKRIVDKVEELFLMCDQLKDLIDNAKEMQRKIADTLVEQALA